jgi:hypothetical protein
MKKMLIAMLIASGVFGVIVTVAPTREAKADVFGDVYSACASDWGSCIAKAYTAYTWASSVWNWLDNTFFDASYVEECIGEGCYSEEVRETYVGYREELIYESGGSYEEIRELVFHDNQRAGLNDMQQNSFVLVMLKDFQRRGWYVRPQDMTRASGG